jgi:hypothetical protein
VTGIKRRKQPGEGMRNASKKNKNKKKYHSLDEGTKELGWDKWDTETKNKHIHMYITGLDLSIVIVEARVPAGDCRMPGRNAHGPIHWKRSIQTRMG